MAKYVPISTREVGIRLDVIVRPTLLQEGGIVLELDLVMIGLLLEVINMRPLVLLQLMSITLLLPT